jgi:asparagine synthetase B (glutamine-hydrolysing)
MMRRAPGRSGLDRAQYADLKFYLPGDILTKVDRTSMAVSLEAREPLLDHRLLEFGARLPEAMRVRGATGKWLMKDVMRRYLPEDVLFRPKMGFVTRSPHGCADRWPERPGRWQKVACWRERAGSVLLCCAISPRLISRAAPTIPACCGKC